MPRFIQIQSIHAFQKLNRELRRLKMTRTIPVLVWGEAVCHWLGLEMLILALILFRSFGELSILKISKICKNPSDYAFQRLNHELRRHQAASTVLGHVFSKSGYHWFHWKVFLFELMFTEDKKPRFHLISILFHDIKSSSEGISNSACTKRHVRHSDVSWVGPGTGSLPRKCFIWS